MDLLVSSFKITLSLTAIYSWIMDLSLTVTNWGSNVPLINVLESHQFLILSWGAIYNLMKESDFKQTKLTSNK